jgi:hypothetical protein
MVGQRLGSKSKYIYETDETGVGYILEADDTLANIAGTGVGAGTPDVFDPANPPAGLTLCPAPKRFNPRVVYIQSTTDGARKTLIAWSTTADLYATGISKAVPSLDTDTSFVTTGRKGEQLTF